MKFIGRLLLLTLPWLITTAHLGAQAQDWGERQVAGVAIRMRYSLNKRSLEKLKSLLVVKTGETYQYRLVRRSIENLYLSGILQNIRVEVEPRGGNRLMLTFVCLTKQTIQSVQIHKSDALPNGDVSSALLSLRRNNYLDQSLLDDARRQILTLYEREGYLTPGVEFKIVSSPKKRVCDIHVHIQSGIRTQINALDVRCDDPALLKLIRKRIILDFYRLRVLDEQMETVRQELRKKFYFFPEFDVKTDFVGSKQESVNLLITVTPGTQYQFAFVGMSNRFKLIQPVWTTKVFERWAEAESRSRLLLHLKNKGYHAATVESGVDENQPGQKTITFTANPGKRYQLGNIEISGAPEISEQAIRDLLSVDDSWFNRIFWLQADPLIIDSEMVRLYYILYGYPDAKVSLETTFQDNKANLHFKVIPGKLMRIKSLRFTGNKLIGDEVLSSQIKSRVGDGFVQQVFSEDLERIRQKYATLGFVRATILPKISNGVDKEIEIAIDEGDAYRMGELIVIGASSMQEKWLYGLFPVAAGKEYDTLLIGKFLEEVEQMAGFSQIKLNTVEIDKGTYNVLLTVIPDSSRFYGFGLGYEDRKGLQGFRGTLEYQGRNIFGTYTSLSAIFQASLWETRGVLSLDTPNLFGTTINSSFKLWLENESYTSYKFKRLGLGPTLLKRTGSGSYISTSLNWYLTKLTTLLITETALDNKEMYSTIAINFSFVTDNRDDPFNPSRGDFFSTDLKVGMPFFKEHDSFFRFMWRYQKNFKLSKNASLALSLRNGIAAGDMSITERFFAGGINSFHGTRLDQLGPKDPVTNQPMGGNGLLLFNAEATFPLSLLPIKDLYFSLFTDIGNVYSRAGQINLTKVEQALGFGIKYRTPLGPLRLDFSWKLRPDDGSGFLFLLGIGNAF